MFHWILASGLRSQGLGISDLGFGVYAFPVRASGEPDVASYGV